MRVSVRIASKSMSSAGGQRRHDIRSGPVPDYVDHNRTSLNSTVIEPATASELRAECETRRVQRNCVRSMRRDAAIGTVGIITFDREASARVSELPVHEQDALFLRCARDIAESIGTTLSGLVVHRDEAAIHAHFQCPAVRLDGQPVSKVTDRAKTSELQDVAALAWAELGIERGEKKAEKVARLKAEGKGADEILAATVHRSVQKLHEDLPREIAELEKKREKNRELLEKVQKDLEAGRIDEEKARKRAEAYKRRIDAAEKALGGHIEMPASEPARHWWGGKKQGFIVVPENTPSRLRKQIAMYSDAQVHERRRELDAEYSRIQKLQEQIDAREYIIEERSREIAAQEHRAHEQAAELKKLQDERLAASLAVAKLLGVENPSMNREKTFKALILSGGDNEKLKTEIVRMRMSSHASEGGTHDRDMVFER